MKMKMIDLDAVTHYMNMVGLKCIDIDHLNNFVDYSDRVIHAHWIYDSEWGYCCSECHYQQYDDFKYCPNCGARMDEAEK